MWDAIPSLPSAVIEATYGGARFAPSHRIGSGRKDERMLWWCEAEVTCLAYLFVWRLCYNC
ncbi:hypothetical protein DPMN_159035 [Dreissena polymorpha]|uniref:Uncharacterized protein n=1 Tax=Dreissena polymorpha TaxID=45954 RepID=A0A9D4EIC4_DREPO|nr:hypothetical protein DPMN_159035 [Dreissena polymorpha]